jgi:DNA-binding response OmpR family regulator
VLVRRHGSIATNSVSRGDLHYDLTLRECRIAGTHVALTNREDQLLRRLLLANGGCLSRQELLDDVWGPDSGADATNVDIYVRRLRDKLAPVTIENVRGLGYRITGR